MRALSEIQTGELSKYTACGEILMITPGPRLARSIKQSSSSNSTSSSSWTLAYTKHTTAPRSSGTVLGIQHQQLRQQKGVWVEES